MVKCVETDGGVKSGRARVEDGERESESAEERGTEERV